MQLGTKATTIPPPIPPTFTPLKFGHTGRILSLLDGVRPRSLLAGGYEPPGRPRYTVKRSIFTPTTRSKPSQFGIIVFRPVLCMLKKISH